MKKIDELRFVRAMSPDIVPHYLIEQVRDRNYSVEDFFKYQQINCMSQTADGFKINPFNHLYVLANPENIVKGVLWMVVDALSKDVVIQTYSIDKEYWNKGYAVKKIADHVKDIVMKAKLNKIYWVTNYPRHSERYNFKRSKNILMEYDYKAEKEEAKKEPKKEKITAISDKKIEEKAS